VQKNTRRYSLGYLGFKALSSLNQIYLHSVTKSKSKVSVAAFSAFLNIHQEKQFFFFPSKRAVVFSLLYIIWMPTRIYALEYIADFQVFFSLELSRFMLILFLSNRIILAKRKK
jgi:hypothetical protein